MTGGNWQQPTERIGVYACIWSVSVPAMLQGALAWQAKHVWMGAVVGHGIGLHSLQSFRLPRVLFVCAVLYRLTL